MLSYQSMPATVFVPSCTFKSVSAWALLTSPHTYYSGKCAIERNSELLYIVRSLKNQCLPRMTPRNIGISFLTALVVLSSESISWNPSGEGAINFKSRDNRASHLELQPPQKNVYSALGFMSAVNLPDNLPLSSINQSMPYVMKKRPRNGLLQAFCMCDLLLKRECPL